MNLKTKLINKKEEPAFYQKAGS